jgi:LmbE family N-acetylglucosaminyl deacetylase
VQETGPKRALIVTAHPDDSEFSCAGTVAQWSREGWEFYYLICTDGSKGTEDMTIPKEELIAKRRREQREAVSVLGGKEVFFLNYEDGTLAYTPELMKDIVTYIRRLEPDAVFTHWPDQILRNPRGDNGGFVNHPDHRCAGTVTIDAVYPIARNRPSFPELLDEGLDQFKVKELYLFGANDPNFEVDITDVQEMKFQALAAHQSQFPEGIERLWGFAERSRDENGHIFEKFLRIEFRF